MNNPVQTIKNLLKIPNQIESLFVNNFKINDSISIVQGIKSSGKTSLIIEIIKFLTLKEKKIIYISINNNQLRLLKKMPKESMDKLVYILANELEEVFQYIETALEQKNVDYVFIDDFSKYSILASPSKREELKKNLYEANGLCKKNNIGLCFVSTHGELGSSGWALIGPNLPLANIASTIIEINKDANGSDTYVLNLVKNRESPLIFKENGLKSLKFNMKEER